MITYQTESPYQYMPTHQAPDYDRLKASMQEHGWDRAFPVIRDEHGNTLDGHHRTRIWAELGRDPRDIPTLVREGLTDQEKRDLVWMANVPRRHLTTDQKRELIRLRLKDRPELSNRSIASDVGVDHHTVGTIRDDLEQGGEIPHVEHPMTPTRNRPSMVDDPEMELVGHKVENAASHTQDCWVEVIIGYSARSGEERQHGDLPHEKRGRYDWPSGRLTLQSKSPTNRHEELLLATEIARVTLTRMRDKPMKSMEQGR